MMMILAWRAENGELYRSRDKALENSPRGKIEELWGNVYYDCDDPEHSSECKGPGDVKNHVLPYLRKRSISQLMGNILSHCGDTLNAGKSCGCSHSARILIEKLKNIL